MTYRLFRHQIARARARGEKPANVRAHMSLGVPVRSMRAWGAPAMWLACHTEEEIAESVGVDRSTVNDLTKAESWKTTTWSKSTVLSNYQEPEWTKADTAIAVSQPFSLARAECAQILLRVTIPRLQAALLPRARGVRGLR